MATSVKNAAGIDDHTGGVHFAGNYAFGFDFHPALRENHAIKTPGDDHAIAFNLALDLGAFSQNHRLLGNNIALNVAVDAERPRDRQRALESHALVDESSPLFAAAASVLCCAGPLPSHFVPPKQAPSTLAACGRKSTQGYRRVVESGDGRQMEPPQELFHQAIVETHKLGFFVVFEH